MRTLIISTALLLAACECAQVPDDLCLVGECDGGTTTGGGKGTGGAAGTGGGGAELGGGTGGGDGGGAQIPDAGHNPIFCETWECIEDLLPPRRTSPPTFSVVTVDLPENNYECTPYFSGGVLMPDDSVMLVPGCSRHFVRLDVAANTATVIVGSEFPPSSVVLADGGASPLAASFAGGVLDCDGTVVAFPRGFYDLTRLNADGTHTDLASSSVSYGGVLSGDCTDSGVLMTSGEHAIAGFTFGNSDSRQAGAATRLLYKGRLRGCYRTPFGEPECLFAGSHILGLPLITRGYALDSAALGFTDFGAFAREVEGAALTRSGGVVLFNANNGDSLTREVSGLVRRAPSIVVDAGAVSWPASRGDGYVYAMGKHGLWMLDEDGNAGATLQTITGYESLSAPFMGLVGHPSGALVVVPAEADKILILKPDVPHPVPGRVLRSPFFNKL